MNSRGAQEVSESGSWAVKYPFPEYALASIFELADGATCLSIRPALDQPFYMAVCIPQPRTIHNFRDRDIAGARGSWQMAYVRKRRMRTFGVNLHRDEVREEDTADWHIRRGGAAASRQRSRGQCSRWRERQRAPGPLSGSHSAIAKVLRENGAEAQGQS